MKQTGRLMAALFLFVPFGAQAQDSGTTTTGNFELEYLRSDGSSDTLLAGDVMLAYRGAGMGAAGLGFDLGFDTRYNLSDGEDATALYAAVVLNWGFGDIAIGMPKGIGELLIERPAFAGIRAFDDVAGLVMPPVTGSYARLADARAFGVRYDSTAGQVRYGASLQKLQDEEGLFLQGAAEYALGQGAVEGMIEMNTDGGSPSALIGVTQTAGQLDFGLYLGRQKTLVDGTGFQASVDYRMSDSLTFGGDFLRVDAAGGKEDFYGVNMEYTFGQGAYGQLGVADGNDTTTLWDASVGIRF